MRLTRISEVVRGSPDDGWIYLAVTLMLIAAQHAEAEMGSNRRANFGFGRATFRCPHELGMLPQWR